MKEKIHFIKKIFNDEEIRTVWDKQDEKYYISIVDVVGVLSESKEPRKYWNWLKNKLKQEEQFELSSITRQLRIKSQDGKYRLTDMCNIEGMFRIIESIPSRNAGPIKTWLAKIGSERINETFDPSIALQRTIDLYTAKGFDDNWISKRIKVLQERKQLTEVWKENGVNKQFEYAILTNEIYKSWSGMTSKEYKEFKNLRKESLRDNMNNIELILTDLSEEAAKRLAQAKKPQGLLGNIHVAKLAGNAAKIAKEDIEKNLSESVVTNENKLDYEYMD